MKINHNIFREYDIRGIVKTDFSDKFVDCLGKSFGSYVKESGGSNIAVSGDIRDTTIGLKKIFIKGILSTGINVIDIGILPTPVNYYSPYIMDIDASVQITGSHNPPEFNGFKFSLYKKPFYGKQIQTLKQKIINQDYRNGQGIFKKNEIIDDYIDMICSSISLDRSLNVAIDCGNACACLTVPIVLEKLGIKFTPLFSNVDNSFPNHHPDPTVDENLDSIRTLIKEGDFDLGLAFDGDADRLVVLDENGGIIRSDDLMILFLPEVINEKSKDIVFDVKCSRALEEMIIKYGGNPIMWNTGHSLIKEKMKEEGVNFAGEMSGHIFFADEYYGFDDALYVALRVLRIISKQTYPISSLLKDIPKYYSTPEIRIDCSSDDEKFRITSKVKEFFIEKYECITVDGVRINFDDGWGLIRASNTQPVIVCRFEASSQKRLEEIRLLITDKLSEFGELKI